MTRGAGRGTIELASWTVYEVRLVEEPGPIEGIARVRRILKMALRIYGLRCIGIRWVRE